MSRLVKRHFAADDEKKSASLAADILQKIKEIDSEG